jgi:hypothetical protein
LGIGPPNALIAKLLAQCLILGLEVLDHRLLVTVDPTGKGEQEKLEVEVHRLRVEGRLVLSQQRRIIHVRSSSCTLRAAVFVEVVRQARAG